MRVLIIGGTGIKGTGITRLLVERGDEVVLYNRGITPSLAEGGYSTIAGDRRDFPTFERQMEEAGSFDCVIDMVCFSPQEAESAIMAFAVELHTTFSVAPSMSIRNPRRFTR